ncbi:MAG: hypothetical protein WBQ25_10015 [Nitrososphaeraceae archaeon]
MHKKITNTTIARMLDKRREFEELNPRYRIEKAIQDLHNLERYYVDAEYRNGLLLADFPSSGYFELANIHKEEEKVKERLSLPRNSLIRYEKVRCSKHCTHNTPSHQYYYAYTWDSSSKRLKKKYIGKQLPLTII